MNNIPARIQEVRTTDRSRERPRFVDARRLEALMAVAAHASAKELLVAATEAVVDLLGERGSSLLIDGGPRVVLATHVPGINNLPVELARYPEITAALETGNVVAIEDVHADPLLSSVRELLPRRLGSVAVVPLVVGDHRLGVLMAQSATKRVFTPEALATASLVGKFTALVLEARLGRRVGLVFTGTPEPFPAADPNGNAAGATGDDVGDVPAGRDSRKRVLLVDDDSQHGRALAELLRHGGYAVEVALDGAQGVRRAQEQRPDVILLGVCLPVLDGISAAERLREDARTRNVPIIFLSGVDELLARSHRTTFEKVDYLPRSQALPELLARVERSIKSA
jgi:CheY-like chemotaxis protein